MSVVAHGGIPGLIGEAAVALTIAGLAGWVWLRERRRRARGERAGRARMRDGE